LNRIWFNIILYNYMINYNNKYIHSNLVNKTI
jgi:hypothetical protein